MLADSTEKRVRAALHARYVARLSDLLPAETPPQGRRAVLEIATGAATPDADTDDAVARLVAEGLKPDAADRLVANARDLTPDIENVLAGERVARARAEAAFFPRLAGGVAIGIGAILLMAFWERIGLPPGAILLALAPQAAAAGLIFFALFDRQRARDGLAVAERIGSDYRSRKAMEDQ